MIFIETTRYLQNIHFSNKYLPNNRLQKVCLVLEYRYRNCYGGKRHENQY